MFLKKGNLLNLQLSRNSLQLLMMGKFTKLDFIIWMELEIFLDDIVSLCIDGC